MYHSQPFRKKFCLARWAWGTDQLSRLRVLSVVKMRGRDEVGFPMSVCWRKAGFLARILRMLYLLIQSTQYVCTRPDWSETVFTVMSTPSWYTFFVPLYLKRENNCLFSLWLISFSLFLFPSSSLFFPYSIFIPTGTQQWVGVDPSLIQYYNAESRWNQR